MKFAEVILPLPLEGSFTYIVPDALETAVGAGCRAVAPFGKKLYYTAIVREVRDNIADTEYALKELLTIPDSQPAVTPLQIKFWEWMAEYYICSVGDVYKAAVPWELKPKNVEKKKRASAKKSRLKSSPATQPLHRLTPPQAQAFAEIKQVFDAKKVCLLHGVTSSGKTEIYLRLAVEMLKKGKQTLYLLPEIALTTQITDRLRAVLGDKLLVYHSGLTDAERNETWHKLNNEQRPIVVLGVRSSLFLPFANLGLVIVDEEHDTSYKQQDPAPRYHARNAAIALARMHGADVLLGSGTPSIDSLYNTKSGKYGLVTLTARFSESLTPEINIVDVKELRRKKIMKDDLLSPLLKEKIDSALSHNEQVILFRNRRGFAPIMECKSCGSPIRCKRCDVSLTYHKRKNRLVCHYCGYSTPLPHRCPSCDAAEMRWLGFGTEKIEEEINTLYPDAGVSRLDLDAARNRRDYKRILTDFGEGKTNILIGTQMVTKGFDFERVTIAGILNADSLMNYPDFRAYERAFQLMMQVSGRAGRRDKQGVVVIQTSQPEHPLFQMIQTSDYEAMVNSQLNERYTFHYPPYFRLITIVLRSKNEAVLDESAAAYAKLLGEKLGDDSVLGPCAPPINMMQTLYVRHIILKIKLSERTTDTRASIKTAHHTMLEQSAFKQIIVHYDVD
ncbi:MAG: primosomal protein N' [Tannerella sp.]|jgi:primosomal protein N' (replication factor Y)|nr:primosomal protein N' [Tannerella sp.]